MQFTVGYHAEVPSQVVPAYNSSLIAVHLKLVQHVSHDGDMAVQLHLVVQHDKKEGFTRSKNILFNPKLIGAPLKGWKINGYL